jgi:hypothetical protein
MWWLRVSYCALSLTFVLGAVGCGSSGFDGQVGSDALTMSFVGFTDDGITQQDTIGSTFAEVDVCPSICAIGGLFVDIEFESFTETSANAIFVNNGTADILLDTYRVDIPGSGLPAREVDTAVLLPGGRCLNSPTFHCGFDTDCGTQGLCFHEQVPVQVLLYDFIDKELLRGDQRCPQLNLDDLTIIPGDVTPMRYQTNLTFSGSDETGERFTVKAGLAGTFFDANNCGDTGGNL